MPLWAPGLDAFTLLAGLASIVGLGLSVYILLVAKRLDAEVTRVREGLVARVRTGELADQLHRDLIQLARALNADKEQRQRDLAKRISHTLSDLRAHAGPTLGESAASLAERFGGAAGIEDAAIMKARLLDAKGSLDAFLLRVRNRTRDRHLTGEP
ncbi:MAG: hypothetical protein WD749_06380 [Phycisphaerales bacterium]